MSSIRSLTAALALALAIPFTGAHAADGCAEAASIKSASKGAKIAPATDSKNLIEEHVASSSGDTAIAAKLPVHAKIGRDLGQAHPAILPLDKKTTGLKAFRKYKDHCC